MGNAITQDTKYLWLMMRKDGGWWTVKMLTAHWRPTFQPYEVQAALDALEAGGFLVSRDQGQHLTYAFTSDCLVLPGTDDAEAAAA